MIRKHFRLRRRLVAGLVFALVAVPAASATAYVSGPQSTSTVGKAIEVVGDHGKTYPQLSQAQIEAMRWQAKADSYYSRATPINTEHSFGASKQQPVEQTVVSEVVGDHGKTYPQLSQAQIEAMRWQAKADSYYSRATPISTEHSFGASKQQPVEQTVVSVASPDGFDWADAGIGASAAFAALLVLSSLLVVGRRSRKGLDNGLTTA
jgi:hypothetical protein